MNRLNSNVFIEAGTFDHISAPWYLKECFPKVVFSRGKNIFFDEDDLVE